MPVPPSRDGGPRFAQTRRALKGVARAEDVARTRMRIIEALFDLPLPGVG